MTCCAVGRCDDPDCQVCTVNERFPLSAKQTAAWGDRERMLGRMTEDELFKYRASLRTKSGRKVKAKKSELRDGLKGMG